MPAFSTHERDLKNTAEAMFKSRLKGRTPFLMDDEALDEGYIGLPKDLAEMVEMVRADIATETRQHVSNSQLCTALYTAATELKLLTLDTA